MAYWTRAATAEERRQYGNDTAALIFKDGFIVGYASYENQGRGLKFNLTASFLNNNEIIEAFNTAKNIFGGQLPLNPQFQNGGKGIVRINENGRLVTVEGEEIRQEVTDAAELAKAENLARYNTGLQQLGELRNRTMAGLSGMGQPARNEIMGLAEIDKAKANQSNISRGLYNTTIPNSDINGINKRRDNSLLALNEQLRREKVGADIDLTKTMETFRAGRTDLGPNLADIAALFQQLGASGG